ncbi:MAG: helix-turn-helix domain-containing protein [Bacteroidota bacterium]
MRPHERNEKGDPSGIQQKFTIPPLKIWCCRFWKLKEWCCTNMAFPYWRIYWNKNEGGILEYKEKQHRMKPDTLYIIPPNTLYHGYMRYKKKGFNEIHVKGNRVETTDDEKEIGHNHLLHLFIHFNLGVPFDYITPEIYTLPLDAGQLKRIEWLTEKIKSDPAIFPVQASMFIQSLILEVLGKIEEISWEHSSTDTRILKVIRYIDQNTSHNPSNHELATTINLADNSFVRLFRKEMGMPVQRFIKEQKINKACALLDHTDLTIDEVATRTGFADRYHFSRIFRQIKNIPPGRYRRQRMQSNLR